MADLKSIPTDHATLARTKPPTNPAAGLVTVQHDFFNATSNGDKLFSVRAGVPMSDAFDQLTILLAAAHSAVEGLAAAGNKEDGPDAHWAAVHVLDFALELTQAMHGWIPGVEA